MNYELAKRLKDAGFPQTGKPATWGFLFKDSFKEDKVWLPSLSELIEACGIELINLWNCNGFWQTNFKDGMAGETAGKTPEEAVANLWLVINKK